MLRKGFEGFGEALGRAIGGGLLELKRVWLGDSVVSY